MGRMLLVVMVTPSIITSFMFKQNEFRLWDLETFQTRTLLMVATETDDSQQTCYIP